MNSRLIRNVRDLCYNVREKIGSKIQVKDVFVFLVISEYQRLAEHFFKEKANWASVL